MPPRIQYAKTSDGVNIAYWVLGQGEPLLYMPPIPGHAELDWERPAFRCLYDWLAQHHQLVRIDARNTGLSQRGIQALSIADRQMDLEAVADKLNLSDMALFGHGGSASAAIGFAAYHPSRVSKLVLMDATVGFIEVPETPAVEALRRLVGVDWQGYREMLAGYIGAWPPGDESHAIATLLQHSQDWPDAKQSFAFPVYASVLLPHVSAPTLICHHNNAILMPIETGRRLAQEIGEARFVTLDGGAVLSAEIDRSMIAAVDDFLTDDEDAHPSRAGAADNAVAPRATKRQGQTREWDVFISHASEDKSAVARPLAALLRVRGLKVWLDEIEIQLGDSLRGKIDHGLANSDYGVVVLSKSFFGKDWPTRELNGLASLEVNGRKVILPVWHGVDHDYVSGYSPTLADRRAANTANGLDAVAEEIMKVVGAGDAS